MGSHLDYVRKVFPFHVVVSLDEDLPQNGLADWVVLRVELIEAVERVAILKGTNAVVKRYLSLGAASRWRLSYRVHVQSVDAEIEGRQVHALEHLFEGLTSAVLDVDDLHGVFLHCSLDESQQVLLIHAGRRVDVRVHLEEERLSD